MSIVESGMTRMVQFLRGITFTTRTATRQITGFLTWNVFQIVNTKSKTTRKLGCSGKISTASSLFSQWKTELKQRVADQSGAVKVTRDRHPRPGKPRQGSSPTKSGLKLWQLVLVIGGLLLAVALLSGAAQPTPKFKAYAKSLNPAETFSEPTVKPLVVQKVVKVQSTQEIPHASPVPSQAGTGDLVGSSCMGMQCTAFVCMVAPSHCQQGVAGSWVSKSSTPTVGSVMIFAPGEQGAGSVGHVGLVSGIRPDGMIVLRHCNWSGGQTVFASTGKFY